MSLSQARLYRGAFPPRRTGAVTFGSEVLDVPPPCGPGAPLTRQPGAGLELGRTSCRDPPASPTPGPPSQERDSAGRLSRGPEPAPAPMRVHATLCSASSRVRLALTVWRRVSQNRLHTAPCNGHIYQRQQRGVEERHSGL